MPTSRPSQMLLRTNTFLVLSYLEREGSGTAYDVAPSAGITSNAALKVLQRCRGYGWVTQSKDPESQRKPYSLTEIGKQVLHESAEARQREGWLFSDATKLALNLGVAILRQLASGFVTTEALVGTIALDRKSVVTALGQLQRAGLIRINTETLSMESRIQATGAGAAYTHLLEQHLAAVREK